MKTDLKLNVLSVGNTSTGSRSLPSQFAEPIRPDLVKRAVEAIQGNTRQQHGSKKEAGQRHSAKLSRRRRDYKTSYGHGISRVPRKILTKRGTHFSWVGAVAPGCVGGRRAHPPKPIKIWAKKINDTERRKAIRSALAATLVKTLVAQRGHHVPPQYPFLLENKFEAIAKTRDVIEALEKLGFNDELNRSSEKILHAGRARRRGRGTRRKKGPLFVVSNTFSLIHAVQNIPGVDVVPVHQLNVSLLAPGAHIGRLTLFTEGAIERLEKEKLFMQEYKNLHPPVPPAPQSPASHSKLQNPSNTQKQSQPTQQKTQQPSALQPQKKVSPTKAPSTKSKPASQMTLTQLTK